MGHSDINLNEIPATAPVAPNLRFIRLKEVMAICGKSRSSVYDAIKKGDFPAPVKLRCRSSAWIASEVYEWAQTCVDNRRGENC